MSRFKIIETSIKGLHVVERFPLGDNRGYLERMYCHDELADVFGSKPVAQVNRTFTANSGTIRGMHYQRPPHGELKYVSCLQGEIFDVALDLRLNSPTFLKWHAEVLSHENRRSLVIPEEFAHGFQTLTEDCELIYFHTLIYEPSAEEGISPVDPKLGIEWPRSITMTSDRDAQHKYITSNFKGIHL